MMASAGVDTRSKLASFGWMAVLMASCTTVSPPAASYEKAEVGLGQWLSLPISKGRAGVDEVIRIAHGLYGLGLDTTLTLDSTAAPVTLADGTVISRLTTNQTGSAIGIAVASQPCFSVARAIALTGAKKMAEPSGGSSYDAYVFVNRYIDISFGAPDPGRSCISDLYIRKKPA